MTLNKGRLRLSADYIPAACLCLCAVVFGRRFPAACLCVLLHEGAHIAVLLSLSDDVIEITLGCMSADIIDRGRLSRSDTQQAMISAAGPIANRVQSSADIRDRRRRACRDDTAPRFLRKDCFDRDERDHYRVSYPAVRACVLRSPALKKQFHAAACRYVGGALRFARRV